LYDIFFITLLIFI